MKKILFLNNKEARCGVYQFGLNVNNLLKKYHNFYYGEVSSEIEASNKITSINPDITIYNYHPIVTTWLTPDFARKYKSAITAHDNGQSWPGVPDIYLDPDYVENGNNFKICRPIPIYKKETEIIPNSIGAFGFGFPHKCYPDLVNIVENEFDEAVIRIHMPYSTYVDPHGHSSHHCANLCRQNNRKSGIKLEITHNYMSDEDLLNWLSQNSINCFIFHGPSGSSGCSSSTDWAIAVRRPIAISHNIMFRHLYNVDPPIFIERGLKNLINQGFEPIAKITDKWNSKTLWNDFQRIAGA